MARTRAQTKSEAGGADTTTTDSKSGVEKSAPTNRSKEASSVQSNKKAKTAKNAKSQSNHEAASDETAEDTKIDQLISRYGEVLPLHGLVQDPDSPTADTILAHLLNAMLSSARISHTLAAKTVECVLKAGYHNLVTLKKSSWQERTEVLTEGGYTRYREKTATALGELAELVESKHDGDLNNVVTQAKSDPEKIRAALKEVKGLGDVGVGIFFNTVQHLWTCVAPALDSRSLKTANAIGVGSDVDTLWEAVGKDATKMCRLVVSLTEVRLQKTEKEFT